MPKEAFIPRACSGSILYRLSRKITFFMALCLFLVIVPACQNSQEAAGPPVKITVAYPNSFYSLLFAVAHSKGFFKAEGLEVTPLRHDFGKLAVQSMLEGKADIAISGDTVVMFAIARSEKISIIAETMTSKRNEAIVARRDRGIKEPRDLEGKRIGVASGTTGHFFLDSFLSVNGLRKNRIKTIFMTPGEMMAALDRGAIDAVAVWQPIANQIERGLGSRGVTFYDERIYSDIVCVSASRAFVEKNPEPVAKTLRALVRAEAFVKESPEETRRLAAEFLKVDQAILDEIWKSLSFKVTLEQSLLVSLEDQTRWARENRLIGGRETPEYLDYIYVKGLQSVKPEAVSVIR